MVYPHNRVSDNTSLENIAENTNKAITANYEKNIKIYGDGVRETSNAGVNNNSWNKDYSIFIGLNAPFFIRAGDWRNGSLTGYFCFGRTNGVSSYHYGFRSVVVPIS